MDKRTVILPARGKKEAKEFETEEGVKDLKES